MVDRDAKIEVLGIADDGQDDPRWVIVNYDIIAKNAERLHGIPWSGVILDEAHFIKNNIQRTSRCLKLLGVSSDARAALIGAPQVYLLTGTAANRHPVTFAIWATSSATVIPTKSISIASQIYVIQEPPIFPRLAIAKQALRHGGRPLVHTILGGNSACWPRGACLAGPIIRVLDK
jgi:hypothetical protein